MSTHQSTETLISDLDAELKRTAESVKMMQETLTIIGHRYAELRHQLAQERAVVQRDPATPPMTELGTALSGAHIKTDRPTESVVQAQGQHTHNASHAGDVAHPDNHEQSGAALTGDDLDHAFDQVGSGESAAAHEARTMSPPNAPATASAAGARPTPRASVFGAPRRAAAQAPAPRTPAAAPEPAPAPSAQRPSPTETRSDPLSGQGNQAARPRMRALGSAGR